MTGCHTPCSPACNILSPTTVLLYATQPRSRYLRACCTPSTPVSQLFISRISLRLAREGLLAHTGTEIWTRTLESRSTSLLAGAIRVDCRRLKPSQLFFFGGLSSGGGSNCGAERNRRGHRSREAGPGIFSERDIDGTRETRTGRERESQAWLKALGGRRRDQRYIPGCAAPPPPPPPPTTTTTTPTTTHDDT